jgi:CelD/BcsL family acetyltransferase involved in cellulose biosynthesis
MWHSLVHDNPQARVDQTPEWTAALCRATSFRDASRMYIAPDGRALMLPLAHHRLFGFAASMPHGWGTGGLLAREPERPGDVAACLDDLRSLGIGRVSVTPDPERVDVWRQATNARIESRSTQVVDLEQGFDHLWSRVLDSSMRAKVRRAERLGVKVEWDSGRHGVDVFYDLYLSWLDERADRRRLPRPLIRFLGRRRDPYRKFDALSSALGDAWRIWIARYEGRPVAAAVELTYGDHAMYFRGASERATVTRTRANELLQWRMIEHACERGCRRYDMGESSGVESLMHFKRRFGAVVQEKVELTLESRVAAMASAVMSTVREGVEPLTRRFG